MPTSSSNPSVIQTDLSGSAARSKGVVMVYADHREDECIISEIKKQGCNTLIRQLDVGDYIISDRAIVERKTRQDFESSIIDGRLFDQAQRITQYYEKVVYIIEGHSFPGRINRKALMAAISSLILNFNITVFFTKDSLASAELICALASKEQLESHRTILIKKPVKHTDERLSILYIASAIPLIGEKTAENLLLHFGSLQNLFSATEQQLAEVKGVGKKRAREIAKLLRMKYAKTG